MKLIRKAISVLSLFLSLTFSYIIPVAYAQTAEQKGGAYAGYKFWSVVGIIVGLYFFYKAIFGKKK
jgi:hypothetical protein